MTNKRKALMTVLAAMLLVTMSVFGTLAYLTSTDAVVNTFTVGNVTITLDEADVDNSTDGADRDQANAYKLMPGHEYTKDPIVHVAAGSEECYLFVEVVDEIAAIQADKTVAAQMAENGWGKLGDAYANIFVYESTVTAEADKATDIPVFETFKIKGDVNNTTLAEYADKKITVTAYAVQKDGFDTAVAAWTAAFGTTAAQ